MATRPISTYLWNGMAESIKVPLTQTSAIKRTIQAANTPLWTAPCSLLTIAAEWFDPVMRRREGPLFANFEFHTCWVLLFVAFISSFYSTSFAYYLPFSKSRQRLNFVWKETWWLSAVRLYNKHTATRTSYEPPRSLLVGDCWYADAVCLVVLDLADVVLLVRIH